MRLARESGRFPGYEECFRIFILKSAADVMYGNHPGDAMHIPPAVAENEPQHNGRDDQLQPPVAAENEEQHHDIDDHNLMAIENDGASDEEGSIVTQESAI